ncbi:MAG: hypothetical protein ABIU95_13900 [Burkholderiales bacterium]
MGLPPSSTPDRPEQLRRAKRAQRERDAASGLVLCQVKLPAATAQKLREALAVPGVDQALDAFLDDAVIDVGKHPNLRDLLWNRADTRMTARDAFALYERNWRFVEESRMSVEARALVQRLAERFGGGVLNV